MRPVSQGEIHAFLDEAFEALGAERVEHIRRLVEEDSEFARSVDRVRELRARAGTLLSLAAPSDLSGPSLAALKERARTTGGNEEAQHKGPSGRRRFGGITSGQGAVWAATIALALGVGWTAGRGDPAASLPVALDAETARGSEEPAVEVPGAIPLDVVREDVVAEDRSAEAGGEASLFIPGLRVLSVGWEETGGLSGLRVDQLLLTGDTIQLRFVGLLGEAVASAPPYKEGIARTAQSARSRSPLASQIRRASLPEGWSQVTVEHHGRLIVARARLSEMGIRALLMTLP